MHTAFGLLALAGVAGALPYLFARQRRMRGEVDSFYQRHGFRPELNPPAAIRECIKSDNISCRSARVKLMNGREVPALWWVWYTVSRGSAGRPRGFQDYRVTVSLAGLPQQSLHPSPGPQPPDSTEIIPGGTLLITWWVRYEKEEFYEHILAWLASNIHS